MRETSYSEMNKQKLDQIREEQEKRKTSEDKTIEKIMDDKKCDYAITTTTQTMKEPILNGDTPKWLIIKKQQKYNPETTTKDIITNQAITQTITTFETQEQNLWQCNKCKTTQQSTEQPIECTNCDFKNQTFKKISEKVNTKRWKLPRWKEIPREDLDMLGTFIDLKNLLKQTIVFSDELEYDFFSLWIIASYKREAFDSICFLMFQGLIESGKSTGLDLLRELGYQMIHTTGVTFPAMCRYTDKWHAGILIDEIDHKIDKRTESGRLYLDFLKPSYRRGSIYATADLQDQGETREYENYGFKAFAGERGGGDLALQSRCITFVMEQGRPEIVALRYIQDELDEMQNRLLNYRYRFDEPASLPQDFDLHGRDRELFSCIIQTAMHIGLDYSNIIEFIKNRKTDKIDEIKESDEYAILKAIHSIETMVTLDDAPEEIKYSQIVEACGWDDGTETSKKKGQRIGYIIKKKLHLKTKRKNNGIVLLLNDRKNSKRLKNLYRRFYISE
ncbi:MAG: hypothetical protein ACOC80_09855 [Petrotogales bacterium]